MEIGCINHKYWVASFVAIIKKDDTDYNNVDINKHLESIYKQHDNVSYLRTSTICKNTLYDYSTGFPSIWAKSEIGLY